MLWRLKERRRKIGPHFEPWDYGWIKDVPYEIWDCAIRDLLKAHENFFRKVISNPSLDFRTKRDKQRFIMKGGRDWSKRSGNCGLLNNICASETVNPDLNGFDTRLIRANRGQFYACLMKKGELQRESEALLACCWRYSIGKCIWAKLTPFTH